jgi:uncharacterized protein with beta-barrel porin domain
VAPNTGPSGGGTVVTLTGSNLSGAASVTFGGTAATITANTATSLTVTAPAHAAGAVDLVVTTPGGSVTQTASYTYIAPPAIASVSPATGPTAGGTSVTLSGSDFSGATSVTFGGVAATISAITATTITVTTPAHAAGAVDVVVMTASGSGTKSNGYTYVAPTPPSLTAALPVSGPTSGGTAVTLTGTNLSGATSVTFGGTAATFTANTATSITATAPAHAAGVVSVVVSTTSGSATLSNGYTYTAALSVSPAPGALAGGTVGASYSQDITASGGTGPYTYVISSGALPAMLALNPATGQISGTPNATGNSSFTVRVTDSTSATVTASYTIAVSAQPPTGNAVSATVAANSSANAITLNITGGAPSSVTIGTPAQHGTATASSISVSYTPAAGFSGTDQFTYIASNGSGTSLPATVTVTVTAPTFAFSPAAGALPGGAVGAAYNQTVSASNGAGSYTYSVSVGALPAGLTLNSSTGAITGTPTANGNASFSIKATDADNAIGTVAYTLAIGGLPPVANPVSATVPANSTDGSITLNIGGGAPVTVAISTQARHGTAVASRAFITYTPAPGFSGTDSFAYTATNTSGTSPAATVTVTVIAPTLAFSPTAGTLPGGTVGTAYSHTVTVTGGTAPYTYSVTGTLPAGLSLANNGTISGTPTATGTSTFTVTVTDANGATGQANYSLTTAGPAPVAVNRTVQVAAGTSINVDLTAGASGGPFTGAAIVTAPAASEGKASLTGAGGAYRLSFAAAAQAAGTVLVRYTLSNQWQTSAVATITFTVVARPDPSKDPEVIGLVNAEAQTAERFATTQISNFSSRLEQLHDEHTRQADSFNVQFGVTQTETPRGAAPDTSGTSTGPGTGNMGEPVGQSQQSSSGLPAGVTAKHEAAASKDSAGDPVKAGNLAFWTGGFVNFGSSDTAAIQLSHTLVGISAGMDYRFAPDFVAGVGAGYGRDISDIGENGTESTGQAVSAAFYASYHPGPIFVDSLLGLSHLSFDSTRFVTTTGDMASGNRGGTQFFGSVSSGYEYRHQGWLVSPYGRFQAAWTRLDDFTETGAGAYDLMYARQSMSMLSGVAGVRGEYAIPLAWGILTTHGRVEYTHDFAGSSLASLGYADLGNTPYGVEVLGLSHNSMSVELAIEAEFAHGIALSFGYQGGFGFEDSAQDHTFLVKLRSKF